MTKEEVIQELCRLCSIVAEDVFDWDEAADCFCGANTISTGNFVFSEKVFRYIEDAVLENKKKCTT